MAPIRVVRRSVVYRGRVIRLVRELLAVRGHRLIRSGGICDAKTIIGVLFAIDHLKLGTNLYKLKS